MRIGAFICDRDEGWSGTVTNLFDEDGDEIEEAEHPARAVVRLHEPQQGGGWLVVDLSAGFDKIELN